jgi:hypothetical protein
VLLPASWRVMCSRGTTLRAFASYKFAFSKTVP